MQEQHMRLSHDLNDQISPVKLLNVLETFEMKAEYLGYLLDLHALLCFLQALADVAEELVLCI